MAQSIPNRTLFVVSFDPYETRERDLRNAFEPFGNVVRVDLRRNYAFVEFETVESASEALKNLNGSKLLDREITVEFCAGGYYEILLLLHLFVLRHLFATVAQLNDSSFLLDLSSSSSSSSSTFPRSTSSFFLLRSASSICSLSFNFSFFFDLPSQLQSFVDLLAPA
eukprot:TRINITY_DN964_c0_g3_i2.p1 TRINITY_DN964_c0_g3~~TRINITY_DN964_c0_g3_i2.p1  ORF type:complete len:167 (-),score=46.72 TRINITY_DN964_c0_g3_i2:582-1082(-)